MNGGNFLDKMLDFLNDDAVCLLYQNRNYSTNILIYIRTLVCLAPARICLNVSSYILFGDALISFIWELGGYRLLVLILRSMALIA